MSVFVVDASLVEVVRCRGAFGGRSQVACTAAPLCVLYRQSTHLVAPRLSLTSGTPLYVQLVERLKHSIATGAIKAGEQLPSVRKMAEDLLINPNTVVRAYRDLESEGLVELRHGSGVFVRASVEARADVMRKAVPILRSAFDRLESLDLQEDDIRRLVENELAVRRTGKSGKRRA